MAISLTVPDMPVAFHVMAKPTGAICNLDCEYCFFLSKEQLYPGSSFRMPDTVHDTYIRQLLEAHADQPEVVVAFQGGEPTMMGLEFFRATIDLERRYARPGQKILNSLQTNGTLLDDEWGEFLAENKFLVGISIDGPADLHDAYRRDKGGKPTFDRVMRGLSVLRRHEVDWNALTTVNAANQHHGRAVYSFLRGECGATFMQFIPIVERATEPVVALLDAGHALRPAERPLYRQAGAQVTHRSVAPDAYGRFLIEVFEEWVRHDVGAIYVQDFETALAHWIGMDQAGVCVHAKTCGTQIALEHNGDVYSCDHYVEPGYLLGNIATGTKTLLQLVNTPRQRRFGQDKHDALPAYCHNCDVRFACNGGCPKDRILATPDGEPGLHYLCAGYQAFFRHIGPVMTAMADQLRHHQPPTQVMATIQHEDRHRPRNSPCPCDSGRKWKHCHGRPIAPLSRTLGQARHEAGPLDREPGAGAVEE